jgi:CDP-diacylglycerol---glycerol-3-phosphate 3-phosphatidyltransferase
MSDRASNWNVPNILTVVRIALVPVMVVVLFLDPEDPTMRLAAALVFAAAMVTDFLDGRIARKYNLVTDFGKLWDPIADKALTGAAFISLSILTTQSGPELPWFFTIIILVREWGITLLRDRLKKQGVIMAANAGGKAKTVTQAVALFLFLLFVPSLPGWLQVIAWLLMWAALVLTVVTGFEYLREAKRAMAAGDDAPPRRAAAADEDSQEA